MSLLHTVVGLVWIVLADREWRRGDAHGFYVAMIISTLWLVTA